MDDSLSKINSFTSYTTRILVITLRTRNISFIHEKNADSNEEHNNALSNAYEPQRMEDSIAVLSKKYSKIASNIEKSQREAMNSVK
jgi:hypothetical protein